MTSATGNSGFTLLELLVVLAIMVLLAGAWPLAAPRLFPTQQLRNEGQRLIGALRNARMTARVSGVAQTVELLNSGEGYQSGAEPHQLPMGVIASLRYESTSVRPIALMFFPDGSSNGGAIELKLANRVVRVEVGKITGRAELNE